MLATNWAGSCRRYWACDWRPLTATRHPFSRQGYAGRVTAVELLAVTVYSACLYRASERRIRTFARPHRADRHPAAWTPAGQHKRATLSAVDICMPVQHHTSGCQCVGRVQRGISQDRSELRRCSQSSET
eukprot:scaffold25410_cov64-Phaeocystis_antarctica.AAC.2